MAKNVSLRCLMVYAILFLRRSRTFYSQSGEAFWSAVRRKRPRHGSRPGWIHRTWFRLLNWSFTQENIRDFPVYTLTPKRWDGRRTILYLHGGGFVDEMLWTHWEYLWRLAWQAQVRVVVPQYPLAPDFCCTDALAMIRDTYRRILETTPAEEIILMGDSAGGGLTLSGAMDFRQNGLPQPRHLIMISPGVEIAPPGDDDCEAREVEKRDRMLTFGSFATILSVWRGTLPEKDWRVQCLYGEFHGLASITLFTGTDDILNLCARRLRDRLDPINLEFCEHPGMFHCWVLIPIPEARAERRRIVEIVSH